jgi:DNA-binding MarR family transcriptional regulator
VSTPTRGELLATLEREGRRLGFHSTMHNHACAAFTGLHPTDWEVLDVLCWKGALAAGEIAHHVGLSNGAVTGAIDRLEHTGWVRRRRDDGDRRRVIVDLVRDRDAEVDEMLATLNATMSSAHDQFSDDDLAIVVRYLRASSEALEASTQQIRASARAQRAVG